MFVSDRKMGLMRLKPFVILIVFMIVMHLSCIVNAKRSKRSSSSGGSHSNDCRDTCNTKKDCGTLPNVPNGGLTLVSGSTCRHCQATLACDAGYDPNTNLITCVKSGSSYTWEEAVCIPKDCGPVPSVENGFVTLDGSVTTFGATATVTCDSCYTASSSTITCEADGQWSSPFCEIKSCSAPSVENGDVCYPNLNCGTEATVNCDPGYIPSLAMITCQPNGMFESATCNVDTTTACLATTIPTVVNGQAEVCSDPGLSGQTAIIVCDQGFETSTTTVTCTGGSYTPSTVTCNQIGCGPTPSITNGNFLAAGSSVGSLAVLTCISGYAPSNPDDRTIVCGLDGSWSGSSSSCEVDCGLPPTTPDGNFQLNAVDTTLGATATLTCCEGFRTTSTPVTITCQAAGWSSPSEECQPRDCPNANWVKEGFSCYWFGDVEQFYQDARSTCNSFDSALDDSNLIEITSRSELLFVKDYMQDRNLQPANGYWNDLIETAADGNGNEIWRTTGTPLTPALSDWNANQPDDFNGRQTCTMFFRTFGYRQADIECANSENPAESNGRTAFALCEINLLE